MLDHKKPQPTQTTQVVSAPSAIFVPATPVQ
jgi:hypothetical protein